jgi:hypothetical protein
MHSRATSFLLRSLLFPIALASVGLVCGCSDEAHTTGTTVTPPPGNEEAHKRSMEHMKSIMKTLPKGGPGR